MLAIVLAGILLSWQQVPEFGAPWGPLVILAVCLCWAIGFCGYGVSLVMFVLALRHLGSARTGAYFSVAPFIGAAISLLVLHDAVGGLFWLAAALMAIGIWLHLTKNHQHLHTHQETEHTHRHRHDLHHQHQHDFAWDSREPHSHPHRHLPISHSHAHYPDIHHRHSH